MKSKVFKIVGGALTVLSLLFVIVKLQKLNIDFKMFYSVNNSLWLIGLTIFFAIHMLLISYAWKMILYPITGEKLAFTEVVTVFCKANLMKYLPGNIMHYVGRNELAIRCNLNHGDVALSTLFDSIANLLGILFVGSICYFSGWEIWITNNLSKVYLYVKFGCVGICVIGTAAFVFRKKISFVWIKLKKLFTIPNAITYSYCIIYYMIFAVYTGVIFILIMHNIVGVSLVPQQILICIGGFLLSWTIGFIMPGSPGGIGVREATIVLLLGNYIPSEMVLLAIVIYRIINILGDFLAFLATLMFYKVQR